MNYWIMKSEPDAYSIDSLICAAHQTDRWEGVRNYQARNFMRDQMKKGDLAFFYHSSCKVPGIVGMMEIVKEGYPDPTAWDLESRYYDPKSTRATPRWFMVEVHFLEKFTETIPLSVLKSLPELKHCKLIQPGNRLSVIPLTLQEGKAILNYKRQQIRK